MACAIKILIVTATRVPPQTKASTVTVSGTAVECGQVLVTLNNAPAASKIALVDQNSKNWAVTLDTSALDFPCGESLSVQASCVDEPTCRTETSVILDCAACPTVNPNLGVIIDLKPLPKCVSTSTPAKVGLTANGATGPGKYHWDFKDGTTETTPFASVIHQFTFPGTFIVELNFDPDEEGCPPTIAYGLVKIPDCRLENGGDGDGGGGGGGAGSEAGGGTQQDDPVPHPDPLTPPPKPGEPPVTDVTKDGSGGARFNCDALLVGAIMLLLASGLAAVIGTCGNAPWVIAAGLIGTALGVGLFLLWIAICGKISSCGVMQSMYRLLRLIIVFGGPALALGGGLQALGLGLSLHAPCWAAILGYYGGIAYLREMLAEVMAARDCPPPRSLF